LTGFPAVNSSQYETVYLMIDVEGLSAVSPTPIHTPVSEATWTNLVTGANGSVYVFSGAGCIFGRQILFTNLPPNTNLSQLSVNITISTEALNTSGVLEAKVWRVFVIGIS